MILVLNILEVAWTCHNSSLFLLEKIIIGKAYALLFLNGVQTITCAIQKVHRKMSMHQVLFSSHTWIKEVLFFAVPKHHSQLEQTVNLHRTYVCCTGKCLCLFSGEHRRSLLMSSTFMHFYLTCITVASCECTS